MSTTRISVKDNILYGGTTPLTLTGKYGSLGDFLDDMLKQRGDSVFLIDGLTGQRYKAKDFRQDILQFIGGCKANGLTFGEGDAIAICSENSYDFAVVYYGVLFLNATVAPLNPSYTADELLHAMKLSQPKYLFLSPVAMRSARVALGRQNFVRKVVLFGDAEEKDFISFRKVFHDSKDLPIEYKRRRTVNRKQNVALMMCSSGTTGLPKGVQITQDNIFGYFERYSVHSETFLEATFNYICVIPWSHVYGALCILQTSISKASCVFLPKFNEKVFLECIQRYEIFFALTVPTMLAWLAKTPLINNYNISSLMGVLSTGATLTEEIEQAVRARTNIIYILNTYGLSESTGGIICSTMDSNKPGSVGLVTPGVYIKIIDLVTGEALGPNMKGEICIAGDCVMKGYVGDRNSTKTLIKDGWIHSGDIGYYDNDFMFYVVDRIKELIKYKGYQVPPAEIEGILLQHPKIADAAVIGKDDVEAGELPTAFVVRDGEITQQEIMDYVAEKVSPVKRLRGGVVFVDSIPKNENGKILRRILREKLNGIKSKL